MVGLRYRVRVFNGLGLFEGDQLYSVRFSLFLNGDQSWIAFGLQWL